MSAKIAGNKIATAEREEPALCARHFDEGFGVEQAHGDSWNKAPSAAFPRSLLDAIRANASVGVRQAETYDRRSFGESVTFEDFTPEARTKGNAKIGWKLFSTANNSAQRAESVTRNTLEVLAQKSWRCEEHRGRVCARSLRKLIAIERRRRSDNGSPRDQWKEKSHRETETVKEWQRGKKAIILFDKPCLGDLEDVGNEISVGKRDTLGQSTAAARE